MSKTNHFHRITELIILEFEYWFDSEKITLRLFKKVLFKLATYLTYKKTPQFLLIRHFKIMLWYSLLHAHKYSLENMQATQWAGEWIFNIHKLV